MGVGRAGAFTDGQRGGLARCDLLLQISGLAVHDWTAAFQWLESLHGYPLLPIHSRCRGQMCVVGRSPRCSALAVSVRPSCVRAPDGVKGYMAVACESQRLRVATGRLHFFPSTAPLPACPELTNAAAGRDAAGAQVSPARSIRASMGSVRMRLPVAANSALHSAGSTGGSGGSPRPVGSLSLRRKCTSTGGDSFMRSR